LIPEAIVHAAISVTMKNENTIIPYRRKACPLTLYRQGVGIQRHIFAVIAHAAISVTMKDESPSSLRGSYSPLWQSQIFAINEAFV
jgi:hypothetical protein